MIKVSNPEELYLPMKTLRDQLKFYDELKWTNISKTNYGVIKQFIGLFFEHERAKFSCYIFHKNDLDLRKHFSGNLYRAYEAFASMQLCSNVRQNEVVTLLADDMSVPSTVRFEQNVTQRVNQKLNRRAVHGVCRVYSKGVELIQLTDLLLGAVAYDLKISNQLISSPSKGKREVLKFTKKHAGVPTLTNDMRTKQLDVWNFKNKPRKT